MLDENELLFDELYEKTKDCGRVQFIKLLMEKEREIKELKEQVSYLRRDIERKETERHYIYLIEKENQELKKQLSNSHQIKNQQKEFIEWLEANLEGFKLCDKNFFLTNYKKEIKSYEVILQKYKEIIGVKDEKINC